ncbi:hypothetical protein Pcinc_033080 [Petrolisthes cinctipes]|uniref:RING-type E3 ubiquitin transferase n=1 Tax=Petrolisthes cinctipes TaxID=88211 RepID=A0AAE1ET69_PETCI|nr:hypothetical protein Pcinc_033080 [Petrolisthes cinctipes]
MPIQAPQWTEFLSCPICCHEFDGGQRGPISLGCGHTVCRACLAKLQRNQCPYDQTVMRLELDQLPVNGALLSLVGAGTAAEDGGAGGEPSVPPPPVPAAHTRSYFSAVKCIKDLALFLKPFSGSGTNGSSALLSRPMQRKLVTLINCQLVEEEGRARAVRAARSLGERTVTELILQHQNHQQLSANLWAAVRARGCQFLGPAMQEEVLKLVLLALEDGSALSRKVLVMFVVQRLEPHFPQASKTSIGHVVQLLYRASCFKVSKREGDSSLMQLKEEFRTYEALRREHDAQIVQIATEAGLRIAPDQWSSLLYGDTARKSHMQSIIDKLQTPQSFGQSVQELVMGLQRTGDPGQLSSLRPQLELLAGLDPAPDAPPPGWMGCASAMEAVRAVVTGLVHFIQHHGNRKLPDPHHPHNAKYKTSMCRDLSQRGGCPRGNNCTFAHSDDELDKYRNRSRKHGKGLTPAPPPFPPPKPILPHHQPPPPQLREGIVATKNGEHPPLAVVQKSSTVEEIRQVDLPPQTPTPFDPHKFVHTQSVPVIPAPTPVPPPAIIQPALAPTPFHPTPLAEYTFNSFPCQPPPIFTQAGPPQQPLGPVPTSAAVFQGQAAAVMPDLYGGNPPTMLLNAAPVYNVTAHPHGGEFCIPISSSKPTPLVSCWPDTSVTVTMPNVESKSMEELKERKEAILHQLETIVGKEATHQVATQIANGEGPAKTQETTSTYSIWTSGADFYITSKTMDKNYDPITGYRTMAAAAAAAAKDETGRSKRDDFIPFDPPLVSRFGPISRMSRTVIQPANPIQSSASNPTDTTTTPTAHRPVPAISPMPQMLYQPGGYTVGVMTCIPATLEHGIVEPIITHLETPATIRAIPADPSHQFTAVREELEAIVLDEKRMVEFQEAKLMEELSLVMNRIEVKRKEMEAKNATREPCEKDLGDFEKNWKFDFDDEKE